MMQITRNSLLTDEEKYGKDDDRGVIPERDKQWLGYTFESGAQVKKYRGNSEWLLVCSCGRVFTRRTSSLRGKRKTCCCSCSEFMKQQYTSKREINTIKQVKIKKGIGDI